VRSLPRAPHYVKPRFYQPPRNKLIKANQARERISIDFKGPLTTSQRGSKYLLIVGDEYTRFLFAFACKDISILSGNNCLALLFSLVGFPSYADSDRGTAFISKEPILALLPDIPRRTIPMATPSVSGATTLFGKPCHKY